MSEGDVLADYETAAVLTELDNLKNRIEVGKWNQYILLSNLDLGLYWNPISSDS